MSWVPVATQWIKIRNWCCGICCVKMFMTVSYCLLCYDLVHASLLLLYLCVCARNYGDSSSYRVWPISSENGSVKNNFYCYRCKHLIPFKLAPSETKYLCHGWKYFLSEPIGILHRWFVVFSLMMSVFSNLFFFPHFSVILRLVNSPKSPTSGGRVACDPQDCHYLL